MYNKEKCRKLTDRILTVVKASEKDMVVVNKIDLYNIMIELDLYDISFNSIAGLRKELNFNNYKLIEKSNKHLKIKKL
ncbi:hypothetical protein EZS27_001779 [termite gut metagenome]|uniref:Uncharacterized protein n=1 Tax=termite gut metagenome TaxID=433724 RepID=A0A5J4SZ18_9ZZZZ